MGFANGSPPSQGSAVEKWNEHIAAGAAKINRDFKKASRYKEWLEEVGCRESHFKNPWRPIPCAGIGCTYVDTGLTSAFSGV